MPVGNVAGFKPDLINAFQRGPAKNSRETNGVGFGNLGWTDYWPHFCHVTVFLMNSTTGKLSPMLARPTTTSYVIVLATFTY